MATTSLPVVHEQAGPGAAAAGDRAVGLVRLLVSFVAAGWIAGAVESVALPGATRIPKVIAFAAVFTSVASLLVAAAVVLVVVVARRFAAFGRLQAWAETLTSRDPDVDRAPVVRAYAIVVVAFVTLALVLVGSRFVFGALMELQVRELSEKLAAGVALVLAVLALVLVSLAPRLLQRPLTAIDRKVRLPLPAPRWTQFLLFVTLPAFVVLYPFVREFDAPLGRMGDAVRLLLLLCAGLQLALLWPTQGRAARVARRAFGVVLALQAAFVVASAFLYPVAGSARAAEQGMLAALGGRIARAATDADRDGTSSLFGGADCAGLDASRSPAALEIMGNGIDDDCDGADGAHGGAIAGISGDERFSGALAKGQVRRYDIVWVIIETVRADHVDAYGYDKPTMPHFRELASESLLFTRAFSQSSATVLSVQSMLTGMDPAAITWKRSRGHPQVGTENLFFAERMKALKYTTGIILENYTIRSLDALPRGYDVIYRAEADEKTSNNRPRRNPIVTAKAAEFLSTLKPNENFFLTVYYPDTHAPYTRHKDVDSSRFSADELGNYDTELAWTDQQLAALTGLLRARGRRWNDTIIVITADHGEEFGEHGGTQHAHTCHVESTHVPLLVRIPGIAPGRVDAPVGLVDVVPTLLELVGSTERSAELSGQSLLVPALTPDRLDRGRPVLCSIASISDKHGTFFRRAVRQGNFALFEEVNEQRLSLFDTEADPGEKVDLIDDPALAAQVATLDAILDASRTGNLADHTQMK